MSKDPAPPGDGAEELFGRWLANRESPKRDEVAKPRRPPARPDSGPESAVPPAPPPVAPPAPAVAPPTARAETGQPVDRRDGLGPVVPPSSFGTKRGLPGTLHSGPSGPPRRDSDSYTDMTRPSPVGFEPVVIASVRKKSDPKKDKSDAQGRLARLRSRVTGPPPGETPPAADDAPAITASEPVVIPPPPVFNDPPPAPKQPARDTLPPPPMAKTGTGTPLSPAQPSDTSRTARVNVPYEDMIALAMGAALPKTADDTDAPFDPSAGNRVGLTGDSDN
jgi:hypothetical protein